MSGVPKAQFEGGCMNTVKNFLVSLNPWRKEEVKIPPNCRDIGLVLQNAKFGDILLLRTNTKLDSAISVRFFLI